MTRNSYNSIVVLGPTASGKTRLACRIAEVVNGEIISADSRQVYKHLDIGTGKDLNEYELNNKKIPYHLIDIREPHERFYLHEYIDLFDNVFVEIMNRGHIPIISGGTGLYLDALEKDFSFTQIKENENLRRQLGELNKDELIAMLRNYPKEFTGHTDLNSRKRLVRAIEVADYLATHPEFLKKERVIIKPFYLGIKISLSELKERIERRLMVRLNSGLIEETEQLLSIGITHERLQFLGLEYKYLSLFILGKISKEQMISELSRAIYQYSRRQMTWFRKMEKEGVKIHWFEVENEYKELIELLHTEFRF